MSQCFQFLLYNGLYTHNYELRNVYPGLLQTYDYLCKKKNSKKIVVKCCFSQGKIADERNVAIIHSYLATKGTGILIL